jgi:cytoskeleton protein RodZ
MMTEDPTTMPLTDSTTAGVLLREYRESHGLEVDALAQALRVPAQKLSALEQDRLEDLPDIMFARALTLAVCRHLKTDAAPVLALLPGQDMSRLAPKNERGLDSPLDRPSFLPQSSFVTVVNYFSPIRWSVATFLVIALFVGFWPEIDALLVFKHEPTLAVPISSTEPPGVPNPPVTVADAPPPVGNMVVTTVLSSALTQQAASAAINVTAPGASDAR